MKTLDIRVLVDDDVQPEEFTRRLVGFFGVADKMAGHAYGAAELDEEGTPVPQFPVRDGVVWDGWPREALTFTMSMGWDPERNEQPEYWQTVKVLAHSGGEPRIVAAETVAIRDGEPGPARVDAGDGVHVYVTNGTWQIAGTRWTCPAVREAAT